MTVSQLHPDTQHTSQGAILASSMAFTPFLAA